jgi:hypothetical protein
MSTLVYSSSDFFWTVLITASAVTVHLVKQVDAGGEAAHLRTSERENSVEHFVRSVVTLLRQPALRPHLLSDVWIPLVETTESNPIVAMYTQCSQAKTQVCALLSCVHLYNLLHSLLS